MWKLGKLMLLLAAVTDITPVRSHLMVPNIPDHTYSETGDLNVAVLMSLFRSDSAGPERCSDTPANTDHGLFLRTEAMTYCTRQINRSPEILPNITLGYVIRDGCGSAMNFLARSLYFLSPDARQPRGEDHGTSAADDDDEEVGGKTCSLRPDPEQGKLLGIVGPGTSSTVVLIAPTLSIYEIPILSTTATSDELMDKTRFEYLLRLAPTDSESVRALFDIVQEFGWSYVAVIYTDGSYGEFAQKAIARLSQEYDVCIAVAIQLLSGSTKADYMNAYQALQKRPEATAVFIYGYSYLIDGLFRFVRDRNLTLNRLFLGGDYQCRTSGEYLSTGMICVDFPRAYLPGYLDYLNTYVSPWTSPSNPYIKGSWEAVFGCSWANDNNTDPNSCRYYKTYDNRLTYTPLSSSQFCDGVNVYARAADSLIRSHCPETFTNRSLLENCITGPRVLAAMKNVSFQGYEKWIEYDEAGGELYPEYVIKQQAEIFDNESGTTLYHFKHVGSWKRIRGEKEARLQINYTLLKWPDVHAATYRNVSTWHKAVTLPRSYCSDPCGHRQYKVRLETECCWNCYDCMRNQILAHNRSGCLTCDEFYWPSEDEAACEMINPEFLEFSNWRGLLLTVMSAAGIILCVSIMCVFRAHKNARLVKAANRHLSILILIGGVMGCVIVLSMLFRPSPVACGLRQKGFQIAVTLIYCPIFVKTNRVYRIFASGRKGIARPRLTSRRSQTMIASITIGIQCLILVCLLCISPPGTAMKMSVPMVPYTELICREETVEYIIPLSYNILLLLTCAVLGYYTRKLPANFNESWYIFISVSTTLFMWMVFIPTYFTSYYSINQVTILGFSLILNVYITIGCLFLPKVYALYFVTEDAIDFNQSASVTKTTTLKNNSVRVAPESSKAADTHATTCKSRSDE